MTTFYYDPTIDVHHRLPASVNLVTSVYAAPQEPQDVRRMFDAGLAAAGIDATSTDPIEALPTIRSAAAAWWLSREWALDDLDARLGRAINDRFEPTWDATRGEFTWGLGLAEEHPRGQYNAYLAAAEATTPGAWARLSAAPLPQCPQVVDVDFPNVALSRAEWVRDALQLSVVVFRPDAGGTTSFRIVGAGNGDWVVTGHDVATIERVGRDLVVSTPTVSCDLRIGRT